PHPQRRKVGDRLAEGAQELVPGRSELRDPKLPRRERGVDPSALLAELSLGDPGDDDVSADGRDDVDAKAPVLAGLEPHAVVDRRALGVGLAALGEEHLRDALEVAGIGEDELALLRVVGRGYGRRKG